MKRRLRLALVLLMNRRFRLALLLLLSATVATSAFARQTTSELRRDSAEAAGRGGEPVLLAQRPAAVATLAPLPTATPESVGFIPGALDKMDAGMQDLIDKKHLAGIVTLVARRGKVVQHKAYGMQSLETGTPMKTDTIGRIYSMTKPVTGVAMMMLYDEGKWQPSDPIAKHIPQFANLTVYAGEKDGQPILEAPAHPPTMGELMSHTAGFTYGAFGNTPVDVMYRKNNPLEAPSLQVMIDRLSTMPLLYQPGTRWVYSVSVDIQGYLVEKLSGKTFPEFLRTRLFEPLSMIDTGFSVPAEKLSRAATIYSYDKAKAGLVGEPSDPAISKMPGLPSGGGGLYGTAADYFRFAQMLLNGGEYGGKRYLEESHGRHDAHQRAERTGAQLELRHRPGALLAGAGIRIRLCGRARSGCGETAGRQGQLLVVGHWRHVVLDRSDQRCDLRRHHPAPWRCARRREPRRRLAASDRRGAAEAVRANCRANCRGGLQSARSPKDPREVPSENLTLDIGADTKPGQR